jgi:hypothetical protein
VLSGELDLEMDNNDGEYCLNCQPIELLKHFLGTPCTLSESERESIAWMYWKTKHCITRQAYEEMPRLHPSTKDIESWKKTMSMVTKLSGLTPVLYNCCVNSCCAFTGPKKDLEKCLYCKQDRRNTNGKPQKQFSYILLIPRLQAMVANGETAKLLRYHGDFQHNPKTICNVFDGKVYRSLLGKRVSIGDHLQRHTYFGDKREMALGLSTNGYAPFERRAKTAWPLLVFNYNLPPEIRFLIENLLCVRVIPGPKKPHDFDSFVWPLMGFARWVQEF